MATRNVLRIGICSCTTHYHGKLRGRAVFIRTLNDRRLKTPRRFLLREVFIPEEKQREALKASRCHFFLDVHCFRRSVDVVLNMNEIDPATPWRPERLSMLGGWKSWIGRHVPRVSTIVAAIRELVASDTPAEFQRWVQHLSPPTRGRV